jgi:DNA/RNA endonuclease YhcR with UshA esterase domain
MRCRLAFAACIALLIAAPAAMPFAPAQEKGAALIATRFAPFDGAVPAESLTAESIGKSVAIVGTVESFIPSPAERTPNRIVVVNRDAAAVEVVFWPDFAPKLLAEGETIKPGTKISAKGMVQDFKGKLQFRIKELTDIRLEGNHRSLMAGSNVSAAPPVPKVVNLDAAAIPAPGADGYYSVADAAALVKVLSGRTISMKGTLKEYKAPTSDRAPHVLNVEDGEGKMEFVFWSTEASPVPTTAGTKLYVTGELGEYKGRVQLKVGDLKNLSASPLPPERVIAPKKDAVEAPKGPSAKAGWPGKGTDAVADRRATSALPANAPVGLRALGPQNEGSTVTVQGTVEAVVKGEKGSLVSLRDGDGFVTVRLAAAADAPAVGDQVKVVGKVTYNDQRACVEIEAGADGVTKG